MDYKENRKLFSIRSTILEMLSDRKYNIPDEIKSVDLDQFNAQHNENNINFYIEGEPSIYVNFFTNEKSFLKNDLKNIYSKLIDEYGNSLKILIVIKDKIPLSIKEELNKTIYSNVEIFMHKELIFNITKNYLVPKHILLSEDEKKEVYKKYNTTNNDIFQKILITDPISKYYSLKENNLCKIIRSSPSSGICVSYRAVII